MRIVVTGGAGFIGSHVASAMIDAGHEVLVIDDLSRGHRDNVPKSAKFCEGSILSKQAEDEIREFRPDAVHHHAAQMDVRISVKDPVFDADINVTGTVKIARTAIESGAKFLMLASTGGAIYGEQDVFPASEDHPIKPESPYGLSKFCGEKYLEYFARKEGVRTVALRYANVYGPRQDPHGEAGVVAIFCEKMLRSEAPIIFGDGKHTRDYVFVGDVVRANLLALNLESAQGAYNIGTGVETDVNRLAEIIGGHLDFSGDVRHEAARPGEQRRSVLDASYASSALGWAPEVSLESGLKQTVEWFSAKTSAGA